MKKNIVYASFLLAVTVVITLLSGLRAHAASSIGLLRAGEQQTEALIYKRSLNPTIGITADNMAAGSVFTITDAEGKTVMTGTLRPGKTFFISTHKLGTGIYSFNVGRQSLQQFIIR